VLESEGLLGRLPSGIVLTGGGSLMPYLCEYVLENLKVPAKVARPGREFGLSERMQYPQMSAAAGLVKVSAEMAMPMADVQPGKREKAQGRGVKALLKGLID
jgi:cell division ATPase FtsA